MPNVVAYYYKSDGSKVDWFDLDKAICHHLDVPYNEDEWCLGWYGTIALLGALGKKGPEIVDMMKPGTAMHQIAVFLSDNYTTDAWYEAKR